MFGKLKSACMEIDNKNSEIFAVYKPTDCQEEKGFAIDFSSIGLPQPESNGQIRFVGDYD